MGHVATMIPTCTRGQEWPIMTGSRCSPAALNGGAEKVTIDSPELKLRAV